MFMWRFTQATGYESGVQGGDRVRNVDLEVPGMQMKFKAVDKSIQRIEKGQGQSLQGRNSTKEAVEETVEAVRPGENGVSEAREKVFPGGNGFQC